MGTILPLIILPLLVGVALHDRLPPWMFMWLFAGAIFFGCKVLSYRSASRVDAPLRRRLVYLFLWPGMDVRSFLDATRVPEPVSAKDFALSLGKILLGLALLYLVLPRLDTSSVIVQGWVGMVGLIFVLHFGLFALFSNVLRSRGFDAPPLMEAPILSTSVSEFWGKRWNRAFRDLTHRFLFRPLTKALGPRRALFLGFVASGLVHDLVISFPARGGYGGPTLFFLIQGLAIFVERSAAGRRMGLGRGWRGWVFTASSLILTAPLLFHRPFIEVVILPFFSAIGARA